MKYKNFFYSFIFLFVVIGFGIVYASGGGTTSVTVPSGYTGGTVTVYVDVQDATGVTQTASINMNLTPAVVTAANTGLSSTKVSCSAGSATYTVNAVSTVEPFYLQYCSPTNVCTTFTGNEPITGNAGRDYTTGAWVVSGSSFRMMKVSNGAQIISSAVGITGCAYCGDGIKNDPGEDCDKLDLNGQSCVLKGYASGNLTCNANCTFNTASCVSAPTCGNGVIDPGEVCDGANLNSKTCSTQGYSGGTLSCNSSCTSFNTSLCFNPPPIICGDGIVNGTEQCDGVNLNGSSCVARGFAGGTLSCNSNCTFNSNLCTMPPLCGNGVINAPEECDGANLNGQSCATKGFAGGNLSCNANCTYSTGACYNTAVGPTVTLSSNITTAAASAAPTLTWTVSGLTSSCVASGGWSGNKAVGGGSEAIPSFTTTRTFSITCYNGVTAGNTASVTVTITNTPVVADNSLCTFVKVPSILFIGQTFPILATMKNTGTSTWKPFNYPTNPYRIRTTSPGQNVSPSTPFDLSTYGNFMSNLPGGPTTFDVTTGLSFPFDYTDTVPATMTTGLNKKLGIRMVKEGAYWFGDVCTAIVEVRNPGNPSLAIDMPGAGTNQISPIRVAGWALDNISIANPPRIASVEVYEGATKLGNAIYGGNRPDVCTVTTRPSCPATLNAGYDGFWWDATSPSIPNGTHTITVKATDDTGRVSSANQTFNLVCRPVTWNAAQSGFSTSLSGPITPTISVAAGDTYYAFGNYGEAGSFTWMNNAAGCTNFVWKGWYGDGKSAVYSCVAPAVAGAYPVTWRTATKADGDGTNICAQSNQTSVGNNVTVTNAVPPMPTSITKSCSTDGTKMTVSWTLPAGYTDSYFRSALGVNNWVPTVQTEGTFTSQIITVVPGQTYHVWAHTKNSIPQWSAAIDMNTSCAATPAPVITLTSPNPSVTVGNNVTINWTVSSATSCWTNDVTPTWTGARAPANGTQTENVTGPGVRNYRLTCDNSGVTAFKDLTITGTLPDKNVTVIPSVGGKVVSNDGNINCDANGTCSRTYPNNTNIIFTAIPASANWKFVGWRITPSLCSGLGTCSITIGGSNIVIQGLFSPVPVDYKEF